MHDNVSILCELGDDSRIECFVVRPVHQDVIFERDRFGGVLVIFRYHVAFSGDGGRPSAVWRGDEEKR